MRVSAIALFVAGPMLVLAGGSSAWAQNAPGMPPAGGLERRDATQAPSAPVGHRQPAAKDVAPPEMPPADQATQDLDKALARKLTICRGC